MSGDGTSDTLGAGFLGLLQGLTEFLPVSSSGHLVLFQQFLGDMGDKLFFDLALHMGTLFVVLWFYRNEVLSILRDLVTGEEQWTQRAGVRMAMFIVVASIPTGLIGLTLEDVFERTFSTPSVLIVTFAITGTLLYASKWAPSGDSDEHTMKWWHALVLGLVQGMAITPGISRSGSTIVAALFLGLNREVAARFSFLMSVPAIAGATLYKFKDVSADSVDWTAVGVGTLVSMVSGYFALVLLVRLVQNGHFSRFSWYCWGAAIVAAGIALYGAT